MSRFYALDMTAEELDITRRALEAFRPQTSIGESDQIVNILDYIENGIDR